MPWYRIKCVAFPPGGVRSAIYSGCHLCFRHWDAAPKWIWYDLLSIVSPSLHLRSTLSYTVCSLQRFGPFLLRLFSLNPQGRETREESDSSARYVNTRNGQPKNAGYTHKVSEDDGGQQEIESELHFFSLPPSLCLLSPILFWQTRRYGRKENNKWKEENGVKREWRI